jgi:chorismate-pyruvate lyase
MSGCFVAQAHRPSALWDADVAALTPYHRALLVNDGTVTRVVEASVLEPLSVDVLDQRTVDVSEQGSLWLDLPTGEASLVRRRVAIHGRRTGRVYVLAESLLVASRFSNAFTSTLLHCAQGLGETIAQMRLESRRELLWFGYTTAPAWAATTTASRGPVLTRSYRIITDAKPAILISESFPGPHPLSVAREEQADREEDRRKQSRGNRHVK